MPRRITGKQMLMGAAATLVIRAALRRRRRFDLRDRVALITGGSRGLGLALARELGRQGAMVAICARDADELERAREDLESRDIRCAIYTCDITLEDEVARLASAISSELGPVDVLINNAGRIEVGPLETATREDFENAMAVHYWGPLYSMLAVLPEMKGRGGRIVNISSIGGKVAAPHLV